MRARMRMRMRVYVYIYIYPIKRRTVFSLFLSLSNETIANFLIEDDSRNYTIKKKKYTCKVCNVKYIYIYNKHKIGRMRFANRNSSIVNKENLLLRATKNSYLKIGEHWPSLTSDFSVQKLNCNSAPLPVTTFFTTILLFKQKLRKKIDLIKN